MIKGSSKIKCCKFAWLCKMDQTRKIDYNIRMMPKLICMNMRKFRLVMRNGEKVVVAPLISYNHVKLILFMWNRRGSCEIMILMLNSKFLNLDGSRRLMWGCQVSTWPWPINRNLNFSWRSFWILLIVKFYGFSLLIEFSIFFHFLTSQTCLVRPNL